MSQALSFPNLERVAKRRGDRFPRDFLSWHQTHHRSLWTVIRRITWFLPENHHFLPTAQVSWVTGSHLRLWCSQASQAAGTSLVPGGLSHNLGGVTVTSTWFPDPRDRRTYAACVWWNQTHNQTSSRNRSPTWNSRCPTFPQPHTANILRVLSSKGSMTVWNSCSDSACLCVSHHSPSPGRLWPPWAYY